MKDENTVVKLMTQSEEDATENENTVVKLIRHDQRGHHRKYRGETDQTHSEEDATEDEDTEVKLIRHDRRGHHGRQKYTGKTDDTIRGDAMKDINTAACTVHGNHSSGAV